MQTTKEKSPPPPGATGLMDQQHKVIKIIEAPDFNLNGEPLPDNYNTTLADFEQYRITDTTAIQKPVPIVKIAGQTISTPEAITVISGQPKSGKSAFCSILIAGAITPFDVDGLDLVEVLLNSERKAVIHFDTEQAPWKHQANQRTILKRAALDTCPDYFLSYNIRQLEVEAMQTTVSEICKAAAEAFSGIHSIFIDGIADFIKDPNDPAASFDIVKYFEAIAQAYFCSIIVIVHTNPGSDKERGHLGSQVQRKAEAVLTVKKEGNVSYLDPKLLRHAGDDLPKIQFTFSPEKGYHTGCTLDTPKDRKAIEKLNKLTSVCNKLFSEQKEYTYSAAIEAIIRKTATGRNSAVNMFKEMKAHELIENNGGIWEQKDILV